MLSVGAMIDGGASIRASCTTCDRFREVDLVRVAAEKGRRFSLIDRRARCTLSSDCEGWVRFRYLLGVYRPLWTREASARWDEEDRQHPHRSRGLEYGLGPEGDVWERRGDTQRRVGPRGEVCEEMERFLASLDDDDPEPAGPAVVARAAR